MHYNKMKININNIQSLMTVSIITIIFIVALDSKRIEFNKYHNYEEMTDYLKQITNEFSNMSSLYSIGKSVLKRELWVVKLTSATELLGVPNIKIIGNIHGNEPVGKEIILHLIQYLLDNNLKNKMINKLLRTTVIHLLPSMNPDGFELSTPQSCPDDGNVSKSHRGNAYFFDLNRNFPDIFNPNSIPMQPETIAIINWMNSVPFIMSLGLHGGALVANYPYDSSPDSVVNKLHNLNRTLRISNIVDLYKAYRQTGFNKDLQESLTPDDDVFRFLAKLYASLHPTMQMGCEDDIHFKDGITNGAAWYQIIGSMQDYNYAWHGCMEITLEMSCCKYPPALFLKNSWKENLKPLLTWMQQTHRGIKGIILSRLTGKPIPNAVLNIVGRENTFNSTKNGEYWKILLPGVYKLRVNAAGYDEKIVRIEVPEQDDSEEDGPRPHHVNVVMEPTITVNSTISNDRLYTYWSLNGGRSTTDRAVAETTAGVHVAEAIVLLNQEQRRPSSTAVREPHEEDDNHDRVYVIVTHDEDDSDLQLKRPPPLPISTLSFATTVTSNRITITALTVYYLVSYYVTFYVFR